MKRLLCVALALVLTLQIAPGLGGTAEAAQPATASITFNGPTINDVTANGLRVSPYGDIRAPEMAQIGGQWALKSNDYIYFFIDNNEIKNAETVTLEVTYYDGNSGRINIDYCSSEPGDFSDGGGYSIGSGLDLYKYTGFSKYGSNEYQTAWIELINCNFTMGHNQNAQFRFGYGSDYYIKSVKLTVGALPDPLELPPPKFAVQTDFNNMIGKGVAGFYFNGNEGRWSHDGGLSGPGNFNSEMWPYVADYERNGARMYPTDFDGLGDGRPALVYDHEDSAVIFTHMEWLKEYGIDVYSPIHFVERFIGGVVKTTSGNIFTTTMEAAEKYGRSFHVYYDLMNSNQYDPDETVRNWKADWILNIEQKGVVSSPNYSHIEGKPVVRMYGIYGSDNYGDMMTGEGGENQAARMDVVAEMVRWFRERGYYVIAWTSDGPSNWSHRSAEGQALYASFDMLIPMFNGAFNTYEEMTQWFEYNITAALEFCANNPRSWADNKPIYFMPQVFVGFGWTNMSLPYAGEPNMPPRRAGQLVWDQAYTLFQYYGIETLLFSIDEYDEGQSMIKSSVDYFDVPTGDQYFLTHSADGWWLSSDYYMRTAGAIVEMMKDRSLLRPTIDIPHSLGPIYWRNSFEMRDTVARVGEHFNYTIEPRPNQRIDPCLNNPALLTGKGSGVTLSANRIEKTPGRSGDFAFHFAGSGTGSAYYKIADVKISTSDTLELRYSLKPLDEAGRNVFVDILFDDGSLLSEHSESVIAARGSVNAWGDFCIEIPDSLTGKGITGVVVGYSGGGSFSAHVDNIIIQKAEAPNLDSADNWARVNITSAYKKGFIPIDIQNNYRAVTTRADFCRMAVKYLEYATGKSIDAILAERELTRRQDAFADTKDPNILAAFALGITTGTRSPSDTSPGTFTPNGSFTREMAATMLARVSMVLGADTSNAPNAGYTDIGAAANWARDSINYCFESGIMTGTSTTPLRFSPKDAFTRQQSIATFDRMG